MSRVAFPAVLLFLLLLSGTVAAQDGEPSGGILLRVDGEAVVGPNETVGTIIVVGADSRLVLEGNASVVVVVGGTLDLHGVIEEQLVLLNAEANLHNGSRVRGDVSSSNSVLDLADGAVIDGEITEGTLIRIAPAVFLVFGIIFFVGVPVAFLVTGLVAMGLFPRQVRTIGLTLHRDFKGTLLTAVFLWIALPFGAFLAMLTLVGAPLAFGIFFLLLPFLWVLGFVAAGIRIGDAILTWGRPVQHGHPYLAAVVGILTLLVVALLPYVGSLVFFLAGALGSAALVLATFRSLRARRRRGGGPGAHGETEWRPSPWDPAAGGS